MSDDSTDGTQLMTKQDKDEAKRILALLVDAAEHDQTPEEAEQELVADGVNVTGFLARVHHAAGRGLAT